MILPELVFIVCVVHSVRSLKEMKTVSLWNDHVPERDGVKSTINDVAISPGRYSVSTGLSNCIHI